jgi:hypothetical protein
MSSTPLRPTAPTAAAAGRVAPLCWLAVLLDGFDLVVVPTTLSGLSAEWGCPPAGRAP